MNFDWSAEDAAFRAELKGFLDAELPADFDAFTLDPHDQKAFSKAFGAKLADKGWLVPAWPRAYGGLDQSPWQQLILSEEMVAHGEPRTAQYMCVNWVGPALILAGSDEQKAYHLDRIRRGDVTWCQGFSEPDAGSDLASLRTRAVRDGDDYVINGEKIWTSYADVADFCFLLARTDSDAPRHQGISIFLVPTDAPGLTITEIPSIFSEGAFNQCVFENVRVPASWRLGPENAGWPIIRQLLVNERIGVARFRRAGQTLDRLAQMAVEQDLIDDPLVTDALAKAQAACDAARVLIYRVVDEKAKGSAPDLNAYVYRVATTRAERAVYDACMAVEGAGGLIKGSFGALQFGHALATGIATGTTEMQLNLIARDVVGTARN
ncbi:acyl-CoA dehydrogenase family protein [Sphingomonas colocasiae]|uniref:Acyl-CoA dehydrogenase family protein n=1 Tax=Sphingomonas colocasiae TaxID=1848973 RepID=A0ABS7PRW4_9SPHN|nr:acyl-CoA dehydrogenase family protein [Sphingomonas colocasiae]MBY8823921.1 acyl-CoA dehydrogenase family protein [Sphingomonas colocasiae]